MSQTNTDYLFQMIAPPADRPAGASRAGDDAAGFSDHLSYASTSVFDVLHQPSRSETLSRPPRRDDATDATRNRESNQSAASAASSRDANCSSGSAVAEGDSGVAPPVENLSKDDRTDDERDDETGGEAAAGVAGASQEASKQTAVKDGDSQKGGHEVNAQAKETLEAAVEKAALKNAASGETAGDAKTRVDEVAAVAGVINGDVAAEESIEPAADSADGKHAENSRGGKKSGKVDADATHATVQVEANALSSEKTTRGDSTSATQGDAAAIANGKTAALKSKAGDDKSADDEAGGDEKSTDRGYTRTDVAAATKVDATPIVSAAAAELAASTGDGAAKEDGDSAIKPVGTKHETAAGPLARALRTASDIARGARSESTNDLPQVDPARFVSRVAKAIQTANERDGSVQLRLSPPDLGQLKLQLTVKDGVMSAALETDNANARRLLLDHLPALRDRLAEQNIRVDRFDVDVRQENSGGSQADPRGFQQNPYQQQPEQTDARRGSSAQRRATEVTAPVKPAVAPRIDSDGINLVI